MRMYVKYLSAPDVHDIDVIAALIFILTCHSLGIATTVLRNSIRGNLEL